MSEPLDVVLHFIAGSVGALAVSLVSTRLSGATTFSAPFGVVFVGLACASLAHFLSPWATPAVVIAYAVSSAVDLLRDRRARKSERSP